MRTLTATLLGVIAAGVMVIAFELMPSRTAVGAMDVSGQTIGLARPVNQVVPMGDDQMGYGYYGNGVARPMPVGYQTYDDRPVRRSAYQPVSSTPRRAASPRVERSGRDWGKTAMVIGGTTAAGAGLGAIFGGKKGALIGAALGGGAGTLYEVKKH